MRTDIQDKFTAPWVKEWESVEPDNQLYIKHIVHLHPEINSGEIPVVTNADEFRKVVADFNDVEGVILSGYRKELRFIEIINAIPRNIPICLVSWGEVSGEPEYFEKTTKYFARRHTPRRLASEVLPLGVYKFLDKTWDSFKKSVRSKKNKDDRRIIEFYNRVDIFASSTGNEFESFIKMPGVNKEVVYSYGTVGLPRSERFELCDGNVIQIGNSGLEQNNHLDIFEIIKPLVKNETKIIVPLTYYLNKAYVDYVTERGARLFGDSFVPIIKHLPYGEYMNLLKQCGFYISGQTTSTGLGNLNMAFRRGAKVFIPKRCPIYSEYAKLGIPVFSLEEDLKDNPDAFTEFTAEEKLHCQNKLYENLNTERSLEGCRNILALLRKLRAERTNNPKFN